MTPYFSGISIDKFRQWQNLSSKHLLPNHFIVNSDFFKKIQGRAFPSNSILIWLYETPWIHSESLDVDGAVADLRAWMLHQQSLLLCPTSHEDPIIAVDITKVKPTELMSKLQQPYTLKPVYDSSDDKLMLAVMKAVAPTFYNILTSLQDLSSPRSLELTEGEHSAEARAYAKVVAPISHYNRSLFLEKERHALKLKSADFDKTLVQERNARLKLESSLDSERKKYESERKKLESDYALLRERLSFAESELISHSKTLNIYSSTIKDSLELINKTSNIVKIKAKHA